MFCSGISRAAATPGYRVRWVFDVRGKSRLGCEAAILSGAGMQCFSRVGPGRNDAGDKSRFGVQAGFTGVTLFVFFRDAAGLIACPG